jgi:hypothetical protein
MRKIAARLTIVATAIYSIVLVSFPSFPSTLSTAFKPQLVERALEGDRLTNAPNPANPKSQPSLERAPTRVPVGCDRAFGATASAHG